MDDSPRPNGRNGHPIFRSSAMTNAPWFGRTRFGQWLGVTFGGRRDTYEALGYARVLRPQDYRARYERGGIAARIVESFPKACWRGAGGVYEDEDPEKITTFEQAYLDLNLRLHIWSTFLRADVLAGLGRYAVILIGAPGNLDTPLESVKGPDDIKYLMPYAEEDAAITEYVMDEEDERWGQPLFYTLKRSQLYATGYANPPTNIAKQVHYTRCIHIADSALDDIVFGQPRLMRVWNLLDDLDKVIGGGAEAFWKRADGGTQFKLDPEMQFDADPEKAAQQRAKMREEFDEFTHELRRNIITRGVEINRLGSDTANLAGPAAAVMDQIAGTVGIPQRILMGSERGQLASSRDKSNWDDQVQDRRNAFCGPMVARQLMDRFIDIGALPEPAQYEIEWPEIDEMDQGQRVAAAAQVSTINQTTGEVVVLPSEIRTVYLGLAPLTEEQQQEIQDKKDEAMAQAQAIAQGQGAAAAQGQAEANAADATQPDESKAKEQADAQKSNKPSPFVKAASEYRALVDALVDDDLPRAREMLRTLGGTGSGNFGHAGRPGEVGGSAGDGGGTAGSYQRATVIRVKKVKDAIPLILQGKTVELTKVEKVHTLMERLAKIAKDAEKKGKDAPKYDACQIVVHGTSFFCGQHLKTPEYPNGMPRVVMPQLGGMPVPGSRADKLPRNERGEVDAGPEFLDYLQKKLGVKSESLTMRSDALAPSQAQLDGPKIAKRMAKKEWSPSSPIFVSRDNYVIDGHHRWAAVVGRDAKDGKLDGSKIRAIKIDAPITEILHIANKWSKTFGIAPKAVESARAAENALYVLPEFEA